MLDTTIYEEALNRYIRDACAALNDQDNKAYQEQMRKFMGLCNYCNIHHQLHLTTRDSQFALKRSYCTPSNLHILIDGRTGYNDYASPLQRRYWLGNDGSERSITFVEYCAAFVPFEQIKRYHLDLLPEIISNAITTYWYCETHPQTALLVIGNSYYCRDCNGVAAKILDPVVNQQEAYREFLDSVADNEEYAAYLEHRNMPRADEY